MNELKAGDYVKIETDGGFDVVELMIGYSVGNKITPDGWIVTDFGNYNPNRVTKYNGATSCLTQSAKP